jgi:hypothetical protein
MAFIICYPDTFRRWHLTDEYYRWLLTSGIDLQHATLLDIVPHDIIAILPDKVVSIAVAALVIYYVMPRNYITRTTSPIIFKAAPGIFAILYGLCAWKIATIGNISIDPNTCTINGYKVSIAQIILWLLPLAGALSVLILTVRGKLSINGNGGRPLGITESRRKYVKLVYNDVLSVLVGVFTLLVTVKTGAGAQHLSVREELSTLLDDGLGMLAFFGVSLFVPGFLLRLFQIDPEAREEDVIGNARNKGI